MNNIKISIIVPVYNVEKYIERCLKSIVNQTLKDIEIIIVNDGTLDRSLNICKDFAKKDNRIKIYSKTNEGLGLTRNYGMKYAKGKYIAFVDSDDFIDENFYEKLYNAAEENKCDMSLGEYIINLPDNKKKEINSGKLDFGVNVIEAKDVLYSMLNIQNEKYHKIGMSVWRAIYKRELINNNNICFLSEREYVSEDICFNFEVLKRITKVALVQGVYYYYCYNAISLSHTYRSDRLEKTKKLFNKLKELSSDLPEKERLENGINDLFISYIHGIINQEVKNKVPIIKKYRNIKTILNDKDVINSIRNKEKKDIKQNVIDFFIRKKYASIILILYLIKK